MQDVVSPLTRRETALTDGTGGGWVRDGALDMTHCWHPPSVGSDGNFCFGIDGPPGPGVSRHLRILIASLVLGSSGSAAAVTCVVPPLEERYREHTHVALVEVTGAEVEGAYGSSGRVTFESDDLDEIPVERARRDLQWRRIAATIRVLESYKGNSPPTALRLTSWGQHPAVTVGATYVAFLDGPNVSLDCEGMVLVPMGNPADARVVRELKRLEKSSLDHSSRSPSSAAHD